MTDRVIPLRTAPETAVRPNAVQHAAAMLLNFIEAANSLLRDGYQIAEHEPEALSSKPAIWIVPCRSLLKLIDSGIAIYYRQGIDKFGPYRHGQFDRMGVAVKWIERPGCCNWSH